MTPFEELSAAWDRRPLDLALAAEIAALANLFADIHEAEQLALMRRMASYMDGDEAANP